MHLSLIRLPKIYSTDLFMSQQDSVTTDLHKHPSAEVSKQKCLETFVSKADSGVCVCVWVSEVQENRSMIAKNPHIFQALCKTSHTINIPCLFFFMGWCQYIFPNINDGGTITEQSGSRANTRNWLKFNHPDNTAVQSFGIWSVSFSGPCSVKGENPPDGHRHVAWVGWWVASLRGHKDSNPN